MLATILALILSFSIPPAHEASARAAATDEIPAEVLLAMARFESGIRFHSSSKLLYASGVPYFCGPIHSNSHGSARRCAWLQRPFGAYRGGVEQLTRRLRAGSTLRQALEGYGCGDRKGDKPDVRTAPCSRRERDPGHGIESYADSVLRVAADIRAVWAARAVETI